MHKVLVNIFEEMELEYYHNSEKDSIDSYTFHIDIGEASIKGGVAINYDAHETLIYFKLPSFVKESTKQKISELFTRINYDIEIGTFIMDFNDGIIGFHTGFYFEGFNDKQYRRFLTEYLSYAYNYIDHYLETILECNFGDKSPAELLNLLEFKTDPRLN